MEIAERDNVTWSSFPGISERSFGPDYLSDCLDEFETREVEMHEMIISKLEALPIKPYFLNIPQPPRSWTKSDEGYSPTEADALQGQWWIFSLDENEMSEAVRELWMDYSRKNILNEN